MRLIILTKRQYTGRDLLDDRYGRLYEIPRALGAAGHPVRGLTLSYRQRPPAPPDTAGWESLNTLPFSPLGAARHLRRIRDICREFRPDLVWASSDAWHAIAAWRTCVPAGIPYVVDLYDNYESFGLSKPPGVIPLLRRACRAASGLTLVTRTLAEHVAAEYALPVGQPRLILGNAVDTGLFRPLDRLAARRELGLPEDALLIGTAGALDASRGIATLLEATERLTAARPGLRLALAGPGDGSLKRFRHLPIDYLGILPPTRVPAFWNALDVAVVANRDSDFGRYCYPQKLQEIVACGVPLVASRVGEVAELLRGTPASLADPDSSAALAERIDAQIREKIHVDRAQVRSWAQRAKELSSFFEMVLARSSEGGTGQCR
ncbi:glycosyltransferase family 4 protein [Azonexus sp.]|uniref:glycosyltransferase family 4 protein n=1 Tax=Azonexus sp. TaxID=1872668 RepID=UPI0035AF2D37